MPADADSPNHPPREILDRLIDEVAWAKVCKRVAAATVPKSAARERERQQLRIAITAPRRTVDVICGQGQSLPREVLDTLRTCELAIPQLEASAVLRPQQSEKAP